jgi:hypothetical protein
MCLQFPALSPSILFLQSCILKSGIESERFLNKFLCISRSSSTTSDHLTQNLICSSFSCLYIFHQMLSDSLWILIHCLLMSLSLEFHSHLLTHRFCFSRFSLIY